MLIHKTLRAISHAALLAVIALPISGGAQTSSAIPVKNVVLVHGAWADGSSWAKVIPLLEAKGLHVTAVQNPLTSVQNPLTSLADDVAATRRIIDAQDGPVLLVGHSYGGAVITEAGNNPKVAGLLYVAAFAPDAGESALSLGKQYASTPGGNEIRPIEDGFLVLTSKGVQEDFAPDLSPSERDLVYATQGPTAGAGALAAPITTAAWKSKPSWFIVASNDRMIAPEQERVTAKRMNAKILTLATSHVPMLSKPDEVAAFIAEAATGK